MCRQAASAGIDGCTCLLQQTALRAEPPFAQARETLASELQCRIVVELIPFWGAIVDYRGILGSMRM